ncbi:hypothetical protein PILCRDRAFT_208739 [Piloderma croceum F 1598]|uniref:Uncharacterized protein n=1 Tax=Piloderma croceum (strain F 1598) TaxID=765440 RepID=A0A0C3CH03_PILCF|nr:hypothetical protein PILCRDRAFT_208739 [Piloderma croceum F 1598]
MFFAYPVAFSLIALLTSFLPPTPADALPIVVHPQIQSHTSHDDIDITSTKVQTSYLSRRTVYNPNIIRPAQGDDWKVGSWVEVIWDTKSIPDGSNLEGKIVLGHVEEGSENEHLDIEHSLASSVPISTGSIKVKVPAVEPGKNYIIVLLGDSGNKSGVFSIST